MSIFVSIFAESKSEDENDPTDVTMATEELPMEVDVPCSDKKWQNLSHIAIPLPTEPVQIVCSLLIVLLTIITYRNHLYLLNQSYLVQYYLLLYR